MRLILRVFVPSASDVQAQQVSKRLVEELDEFAPVQAEPPRQYWKVPEWFEHTLVLSPATPAAFHAVLARAASGWSHFNDGPELDSLWNPQPGSAFILPEVTWAEVLLVHETRAYVVYLRSNGIALSREPAADWRDLQKMHGDYMASLGPWTLAEIADHFASQFGDESQWPLQRGAIEHFMTASSELVLKSGS